MVMVQLDRRTQRGKLAGGTEFLSVCPFLRRCADGPGYRES